MISFETVSKIINEHGFTPDQLRAITTSGNIIVSAGAGSGKTTVMIARIINKILNGAKLDEMLIVTFTRAAAAEMRVKLNEKLVAVLQSGVGSEIKDAARTALDTMSVCNIGTLHSYCQKLVKNYFYAVGIDPSSTVCEDGEAAIIKRAAVRDAVMQAWRQAQTQGDDSENPDDNARYFGAMYEMLSTRRSDEGVADAVADILEFALSTPSPREYLTDISPDETYFAALDKAIESRRNKLCEKTKALRAELAANGMAWHADVCDEFDDYLDGKIDSVTSKAFRAKTETEKALHERFKALKKKYSDHKALADEALAAKSIDGAPYVKALCAVALDALDRYVAAKAKLAKIDYSDLEHGAYTVLCDPACMGEISRDIKYVFIDEFQDVNPLQSAIADTFRAAGAEMFVVGDVKQSIYGFRRCSPSHFIAAISRAENSADDTHIALAENFRSSEAVIDFVNRVFSAAMTEDFGGVDYASVGQKLVWGNRSAGKGKAEFVLADNDCDACDENGDADNENDADISVPYSVVADASETEHDREAEFIADRLVEWMAGEIERAKSSDGKYAPSWSNAAVLMRTASREFCSALAAELAARQVPFDFGRKSSVKTYPEAVALMDIARCVDNRYDDVALYTAMRSPMGGFSDGELLDIAISGEKTLKSSGITGNGNRGGSKYAFVQKVSAYSGALDGKKAAFLARLNDFAEKSKVLDSADFLGYVTSSIDYFRYVFATGGKAQAVEALIEQAASRRCDIHTFLNYYDNADFDLDVDGGGDAVNITTIHSSKGLEYDYVIVADIAHKFNERDSRGRVIVSENGVFVKVPDFTERTLKKSAPYMLANITSPSATKAEELRLFYVALTRAKRFLTVCGKNKNFIPVEPSEAKRMLDFMSGFTPAPPDAASAVKHESGDGLLPVDESIVELIKARVKKSESYVAVDLPIKTCVTALARAATETDDYTASAPVLTSDETDLGGDIELGAGNMVKRKAERSKDGDGTDADRRLRGTAYHRAMELVDFYAPDFGALRRDCENYSLVNEDEIARAAQVIGKLASGAAFVARERYFIFNADAQKLFGKSGSTLVQGVIDLLIAYSDGSAVIVDYKTGDPEHLVNDAYKTQLELYAAAVENCTPYKVKHKYLYSFEAGELIEMII